MTMGFPHTLRHPTPGAESQESLASFSVGCLEGFWLDLKMEDVYPVHVVASLAQPPDPKQDGSWVVGYSATKCLLKI